MNTLMWTHPITPSHVTFLQDLGVEFIMPISKKLACGDIGIGAMEEPNQIANIVKKHVNYISNHDTNEMLH